MSTQKSYREYLEEYISLCKDEEMQRGFAKADLWRIIITLIVSLIIVVALSVSIVFGTNPMEKFSMILVIIIVSVFTTLFVRKYHTSRVSSFEWYIPQACEAKEEFLQEFRNEALVNLRTKFFLYKIEHINLKKLRDINYVRALCEEAKEIDRVLQGEEIDKLFQEAED